METSNMDNKHPETLQLSPARRRKARFRTKANEKERTKRVTEDWLLESGWKIEKDLSANKTFLCGPLIIEGRLHATDKLCLRGRVAVMGKLECEGNLTLCGSLHCRTAPAVVKNMIVVHTGMIHGDVVANAGAYIDGTCTVLGKLTVTGNLRIRGTLRCKALDLTGTLKRIGSSSRLVVQGEVVINGADSTLERLAGLMRQL
ncbi:hypothetical protein F5Y03DRAFT_337288 [Xylaria venustula]|nr:hypothetical protein F5Y03DRAFT_337288 [Xylaria venustula]